MTNDGLLVVYYVWHLWTDEEKTKKYGNGPELGFIGPFTRLSRAPLSDSSSPLMICATKPRETEAWMGGGAQIFRPRLGPFGSSRSQTLHSTSPAGVWPYSDPIRLRALDETRTIKHALSVRNPYSAPCPPCEDLTARRTGGRGLEGEGDQDKTTSK